LIIYLFICLFVCLLLVQTGIDRSIFSDLSATCFSVASNVSGIESQVSNGKSPQDICLDLGSCNDTKHITSGHIVQLDECTICEEVTTIVEGALAANKTETEIVAKVNELCTVLASSPLSSLAPACAALAKDIPNVIQLVTQKFPPSTVCNLLGLCGDVTRSAFPLSID
jgi:hypothetical protein